MPAFIRYSQTTPRPWANGLGMTTELISWACSRTLFDSSVPEWRLSIAHLAGAAAFSSLPGVRRIFLPVGTSIRLTVDGVPRSVDEGTVTEFDGQDVVELVDLSPRPGHAVNLMVRNTSAAVTLTLVVGSTDDDLFPTCLLAVALASFGDVELFDVLAANATGNQPYPLPVVMVYRSQRIS